MRAGLVQGANILSGAVNDIPTPYRHTELAELADDTAYSNVYAAETSDDSSV